MKLRGSRPSAVAARFSGLGLAICWIIFGAWLTYSLVAEPGAGNARPQVSVTAITGNDLDALVAQLEGSRAAVANPVPADLGSSGSYFAIDIRPLPDAMEPQELTLELQKAYAPTSRAWQILRTSDPRHPYRFIPLVLDSGTRGTLLEVPDLRDSVRLLLLADNLGARQAKYKIWYRDQLRAVESYSRSTNGATLGILLFLTAFGSVIAVLVRDSLFLYFAAWSLASLRSVAINEGWATNWMFQTFSPSQISVGSAATLALHCLFTILLFSRLFKKHLGRAPRPALLKALCTSYGAFIAISPLSEHSFYYPGLWLAASLGMLFIGWVLVTALRHSREGIAYWYASFWCITLAGLAGEIAYAAGLLSTPIPLLNAQMAATAGAFVMAITLAQRVLDERFETRRAQHAELDAMKRLANTYTSMPIGLFRMERSGSIVVQNPAFQKLFGLDGPHSSRDDAVDARRLFGETCFLQLQSSLDQHAPVTFELPIRCPNGETRQFLFTARNSTEGIEASVQDITARVKAEARLARLVDHDPQTSALNQRGLEEAVNRALSRTKEGSPCALIDINIDRFKTFNDLYGHLIGDQLLSATCDRLSADLRSGDEIARIGDSFKVVTYALDFNDAVLLAKHMHSALAGRPFEISGRILTVTASVGIIDISPAMNVRDAIAAASQACQEAKTKGRNQVLPIANQDLALRDYIEELHVQADLQQQLESQRFYLEFQPIVSFHTPFESMNYEVLVRMRGENGDTISPGRFIPAAERNGQMSQIDRWVLMKTLHWLDQHPAHLERLGYATINLSGASLNDSRFVDNLFSSLADFPKVVSRLCFEITESVALVDRNATRRFSERVHGLGGKIALDDFGAGYTSFTYLREIDADIIKIDGSFVRDINTNPANYAITRMIIDLSHELGKRCVAEWAERTDVIATLVQLGVDYGQGYALARPMNPFSLLSASSAGDLVSNPAVRALLNRQTQASAVAVDLG